MMADHDDLDDLRDRYCQLFLRHLSAQEEPHKAAMLAGMMQAALSVEAHAMGRMATAERIRDLADLIERDPSGGKLQ
ncbi:MAG: hypothetical protein LC676_08915 [Loktanella sp.]|nr:hypothetical protein [Loktanella sp.]